MPEKLKDFAELTAPDHRRLSWKIRNHDTGELRELTLSEHYDAIARLELEGNLPAEIVSLFNTARNVLLYSWYVYGFTTVAELQAYATLEYALRWRLGHREDDRAPTLGPLLRKASAKGLLKDEPFQRLSAQTVPPIYTGNPLLDGNIDRGAVKAKGHVTLLCDALPRLRNQLAHGSVSVWPSAIATFLVVKTALDALAATWSTTPS